MFACNEILFEIAGWHRSALNVESLFVAKWSERGEQDNFIIVGIDILTMLLLFYTSSYTTFLHFLTNLVMSCICFLSVIGLCVFYFCTLIKINVSDMKYREIFFVSHLCRISETFP